MSAIIPLEHGKYYHIYNRGNNSEDLFRRSDDYKYFLQLYDKYIDCIAETYSWVLMKNHFHFLVRIKEEKQIEFLPPRDSSRSSDAGRSTPEISSPISKDLTFQCSENLEGSENMEESETSDRKKPVPYRQFSHLFNAYTKYYNKQYLRTGSLFEKNFHRIVIDSERYFRQLILYIHLNPVHHGITDNFKNYLWSSFSLIITSKPTKVQRNEVIDWFNDIENFVEVHNLKANFELLQNIIIE
jgi:putative transposase